MEAIDYTRALVPFEHVALNVPEMEAAGADVELLGEPDYAGDILCNLRDPFGLAIQLVERAKPLLAR